jgi:hypothetical protein
MCKKIIVVALLATLFVSCKSKSAFNYSQDIVAKERSMKSAMEEAERKAPDFFTEEKFDSLAAVGEKMEKMVQQKIDEIEAMKVPDAKGASDFKTASIRYFTFIKAVYTNYKSLGKAASAEEREKLVENLQEMVNKKKEIIDDMQNTQRKFATDNGFKIE